MKNGNNHQSPQPTKTRSPLTKLQEHTRQPPLSHRLTHQPSHPYMRTCNITQQRDRRPLITNKHKAKRQSFHTFSISAHITNFSSKPTKHSITTVTIQQMRTSNHEKASDWQHRESLQGRGRRREEGERKRRRFRVLRKHRNIFNQDHLCHFAC